MAALVAQTNEQNRHSFLTSLSVLRPVVSYMANFLTIIVLALIILGALAFVVCVFVGKRSKPTHEEVNKRYIYRAEPSADQVTQMPNRLNENEITKE